MTGTVKRYDAERGFGFLIPHEKTSEHSGYLFFHVKQFDRVGGQDPVINVGDQVQFDLADSDRGTGKQAIDCELLTPVSDREEWRIR